MAKYPLEVEAVPEFGSGPEPTMIRSRGHHDEGEFLRAAQELVEREGFKGLSPHDIRKCRVQLGYHRNMGEPDYAGVYAIRSVFGAGRGAYPATWIDV